MKLLLVLTLCLALSMGDRLSTLFAFLKNYHNEYDLETVANYKFVEHDRLGQKLLIAITDDDADKTCHVITLDKPLRRYLKDPVVVTRIAKEIYHLILDHKANETALSMDQSDSKYKDNALHKDCVGHKIYDLTYHPSFPRPTYPPGIEEPSDDILDTIGDSL